MRETGRHRPRSAPRRGSALLPSLIIVVLMASLGAGLIQVQSAGMRQQLSAMDRMRALYIAEAGLAESFSAICVGKSGIVGSPEHPAEFAGGVYWVDAEEDATGRITLDSVGLYGSGRFAVSAVVRRSVNPLGMQGMHGESDVILRGGAILDGYDSRLGSFDSQLDPGQPFATTGGGGRLSSNGDVTLAGDPLVEGDETFVFGDALAGPEGTLTIDPDVVVTGAAEPLLSTLELPRIDVPDLGSSQGTRGVAPGTTLVLTGDHRFDALSASTSGTLRVQGPARIHVDSLDLASGARLELDSTAGPVILYVQQSFQLPSGSQVETVSGDPTGTAIYLGPLTDGTVQSLPSFELASSGTFHGLLYAPNIDVELPSDLRVLGAVAGQSVTLAEGAHLTYDRALATSPGLGIDTLPGILSWKIDELPQDPLVQQRIDPILQLALRGTPPVPSPLAHREQTIKMEYQTLLGVSLVYTGLDSLLDWMLVGTVQTIQWQDPDTLSFFPTPALVPRVSGAATVTTF